MTLVVHPHFHRRRSGATRHVEEVVPALARSVETAALGQALDAATPQLRWGALWPRLRTERVIWHAHRINELLAGLVLRLVGRDVRLVFTRHSSDRPRALTRWAAARADRLISLTPVVARELGMPSTIVPHGVDVERFSPPSDRRAAWAQLALPGTFGIGVVGRVRPDKGQGDFEAALRPLWDRFPAWHGVLVGLAKPGERAWADELLAHAAGHLTAVGEQREIVPWYRGLTILVHPSYKEAHSLVLLEALAAGCCVVATSLEHHPEIIDHGRTGFLYPPGDVEALRRILEELMADPARAEQVGRQAAADARERFGLDREVAALLELYRALP